jgi:Uma2 family endonuclease
MVKLAEIVEEIPEVVPEPDDGLYEIVEGVRQERIMGVIERSVGNQLCHLLQNHCHDKDMGRVFGEFLFRLPIIGNVRQPDVSFVSYGRWAKDRGMPRVNAWPIAPDLAVEVVSPTDLFQDLLAKVQEYFTGGVQRVWLILPNLKLAYLYSSDTQVRIITEGEDLADDSLLPGFRVPLATLFPKIEEVPPTP